MHAPDNEPAPQSAPLEVRFPDPSARPMPAPGKEPSPQSAPLEVRFPDPSTRRGRRTKGSN